MQLINGQIKGSTTEIYKCPHIGIDCCNTVSEDFSNVEERASIPRPQRDVLD